MPHGDASVPASEAEVAVVVWVSVCPTPVTHDAAAPGSQSPVSEYASVIQCVTLQSPSDQEYLDNSMKTHTWKQTHATF